MSTLNSKLIVSLIDRATAPARAVTTTINRLTAASAANAARMSALQGRMIGAAGGAYALYQGMAAPIKAAMAFESAMADVRKVVDFPTPDAFKKMGLEIRALSLEMPLAAEGIAAIVAAAGQSGIANADLLEFAQMAAKVSTAWDTSAGETGEALAKLKTALSLSIADVGSLADAINYLGNKSAASAPDILDVVTRVAPMAKQFGLTAEQAAAFGAAMVGSGFQSEVASTSFLNMGRALTKGGSATKRQAGAFKSLGLSAKGVAKSMQKDATGTIMDVLARLRKVPAAMRAAMISDLFGDEARALGPLISNATLLADTLGLVGDKAKYAGSAQAEFEERSKTTENAIQLFKNRVVSLAISIGDALTPGLNLLTAVTGPVVTSISDLAQRFPMVTAAIVGVTAALVAFKVASIAGQYAGLFLKGAFLDVKIAALSAGRAIGRMAIAPVIASFNALRTAMIGYAAAAAIVGHGGALKMAAASLLGLLNPMRLVTVAMRVLKVAVIGTGIGAVLVGIAAAGTWIYNNWSGISTMFEAFKGAFMRAIEPIMPAIQPIVDGFSWVSEAVSNLLGPIDEMGGGWTRAGLAAGKFVGDLVVGIVELPGKVVAALQAIVDRLTTFGSEMMVAGQALMNSLLEGIKAGAAAVLEYVAGIGTQIKKSIAGAASGAWSNLKSAIGLGETPSPAAVTPRAAGGPVRAGGAYLVGERGPELVTFGKSGMVHDALKTARVMRNAALASAIALPAAAAPAMPSFQSASAPASQARHAPAINAGGVTIYIQAAPGQSPDEIAQAVERQLSARLNALSRGAYSDGAN